jgi:hypothetical protein
VVSPTPRPIYPRERPGTHCTGSWVGPRAGLDACEKSRPHRDSENHWANMKFCLRFEVLTVVSMKIQAFWHMMPCRMVYRHSGVNLYLHLQGVISPRGQNEISLTVQVLLYFWDSKDAGSEFLRRLSKSMRRRIPEHLHLRDFYLILYLFCRIFNPL